MSHRKINIIEGFTLAKILPTILPQLDNIKQFAVVGKFTEQASVYPPSSPRGSR